MRKNISNDDLTEHQLIRKLKTLKNDKEKISVLIKLGDYYREISLDKSMSFYEEAYHLSIKYEKVNLAAKARYKIGYNHFHFYNNVEKAKQCYLNAKELYESITDSIGTANMTRLLGEVCLATGELQSALDYLFESIRIFSELNNKAGLGLTYEVLGQFYVRTADYKRALENYNESIILWTESNNQKQLGMVFSKVGQIHFQQGNYSKAIENLQRSIQLFYDLNLSFTLSGQYTNIATVLMRLSDYESALIYLHKSYALLKDSKHNRSLSYLFNTMGCVQLLLGNYDDAVESFVNSIINLQQGGIDDLVNVQCNLANAYLMQNRIQDAEKLLQTLVNSDKSISQYELSGVYYIHSKILTSQGCYVEALVKLNQSIQIRLDLNILDDISELFNYRAEIFFLSGYKKESIDSYLLAIEYGAQTTQSIEIISAHYKIALLYEELGMLENSLIFYKNYVLKERELHKIHSSLRYNMLLVEYNIDKMRHESTQNKIRNLELEKELDAKKNELTAITLHLVNKNEFLVDLKEHIGDNIEDTNLVLKTIADKIDLTSRDDNDWKRFEDQFLQVNPSFSKKLMDASNNTITKTELKICQLLKTGLSSKEVANIMFLSKRTVDTHRHNIHKKLQLKDVHLTSWLVGL